MNPAPSENILVYVLWALVGLVVAMGLALVYVIKQRNIPKPETLHTDGVEIIRQRLHELSNHIQAAIGDVTLSREQRREVRETLMRIERLLLERE